MQLQQKVFTKKIISVSPTGVLKNLRHCTLQRPKYHLKTNIDDNLIKTSFN